MRVKVTGIQIATVLLTVFLIGVIIAELNFESWKHFLQHLDGGIITWLYDLATFLFQRMQVFGGIILAVGYTCQILKATKTKNVNDFSEFHLIFMFIALVMNEAYLIHFEPNLELLIVNLITCVSSGWLIILFWLYKRSYKPVNIELESVK